MSFGVAVDLCSDGRVSHLRMNLPHNAMHERGYWPLNIIRSRPWPFKVTWRHRSRDRSTPRTPLPSYWCSIGTEPLSPSVFEIFGSKSPVQCKSSLRMCDITWPAPPIQNLGTYFSFSPPHGTFIGLQWRIRGVCSWDPQCTLRLEVGVKLTPGPINCLILKNGFKFYRPDFVTFNIYLLPSIWHI